MWLFFFKALHIVGFTAWFGGLFYLGRLFVYHVEAGDKPQPEQDILKRQYQLMESRVYKIIIMPAMNLTWICGLAMLFMHGMDWLAANPWMHVKLLLLVLLTGFQIWSKTIIKKLETGKKLPNAFRFRLLNEAPTVFLLSIVLLAVYRNGVNYLYFVLGVGAFIALIYSGAVAYRKKRESEEKG